MKIEIEKVVRTTKTINTSNLKIEMGSPKDIDSTNFNIFYNNECIGDGHLNNRTNFAHVGLFYRFLSEELEDFLVKAIENREIMIY